MQKVGKNLTEVPTEKVKNDSELRKIYRDNINQICQGMTNAVEKVYKEAVQ